MNKPRFSTLQWVAIILLAVIATACASIGRPQGGPRDQDPPVYVTSNPKRGALNVDRKVIDIYFNENVQLQDAFNKVIVSPVQKDKPRVTSNGRHVRVNLQDTLIPNTTYTIDFGDAIKDLNEGNVLDGFATYFSTGDTIDSLSISGMVLEARTLEPAQGMLVGVYSNLADSAIHTLPFERVARTNQLGQFSVLNLKPGQYRIYALKDDSGDSHWTPGEDVAFYDLTISPHVEEITVTDTLRSASDQDSLVERKGWANYPNDILLTWFSDGYTKPYLKEKRRDGQRKIYFETGEASDSLLSVTIAKGPMAGRDASEWALVQASPTMDTITYWIKDTTVLHTDSLYLAVKYRVSVDSLRQLTWRTDTLPFIYNPPQVKKSKKDKEEEAADTLPPQPVFANLRTVTGQNQEVYMPVIFSLDQPIDTLLASGLHLEMLEDTLWTEQKNFIIGTDSLSPLFTRNVSYNWQPGEKYRLTIDSAAVRGIYNEHNKALTHEFTVKKLEEYSALTFHIIAPDTAAMVVELLDKTDKPIRLAPVVNGYATFKYLAPGEVYARLFVDRNSNGKWDTGLLDSIQPEDVYYCPEKIKLMKYADKTLEWSINNFPVDKQKPYAIKKNKPKLKAGEKAPEEEDDEDDDDYFGGFNNPTNNNRRNTNNSQRSSNRSSGMGGMGGFGSFPRPR